MKVYRSLCVWLCFLLVTTTVWAFSETDRARATNEVNRAFASMDSGNDFMKSLTRKSPMVSGAEWLAMSHGEKIDVLLTSMESLQANGVWTTKSPEEYVAPIDSMLLKNKELQTKDVTSLLAQVIYDSEPDLRPAIDKLKKKP